ncbi:lysis protein [Pseudomonas sp. ITA]|uniref:lysis system i-spanin subunit Rz n=1 Tax=Pseudomonas sp. ITA TaxID=2825841 RepID=UPI002495A8BF|nr:lysis system i-spanin subunit Rz [Pseudomonas sp. ITA]MDI2145889.1 lysis protein [Pseudomonas sp. ITA]
MITLFFRLMPFIIAVSVSAFATWMIQDWRYNAKIDSIERINSDTMAEISRAAAHQLQAQLEIHQEQTHKITQLDQQHYEELKHVQETSAHLAADLAATHQRLSVRVRSCATSHVPAAANASRVDDGTQRAELYPEDAAALATITGDADRCAVKLTGLQAYVCSITPDSAGCGMTGSRTQPQ